MNNTEAVNLAAYRIGHGSQHRITSMDEGSELSDTARDLFQNALDVMLSQYAWPFARVSTTLAAESGVVVPTGYAYAYTKPTNALSIHFIESEGFHPDWLAINDYRGQFRLMAHPTTDGQIIVSQTPEAWIWYTKRLTSLQFTSPLFAEAFVWKLAGDLALAMKADPKMAENASKMYEMSESTAIAQAHNESGGMVRLATIAEMVRGYGGRDPAPWLPGHGHLG